MAFKAGLAASSLGITWFPVSRMRTDLSAAVALDADISIRMTGLAGLEVSPCFVSVVHRPVPLPDITQLLVRFNLQGALWKAAVAGCAELLGIMATVTGTRVILCLDRMDLPEVCPVGFRHIVGSGGRGMQIPVNPASCVTVKAEGLLVTVLTVVRTFFCVQPVLLGPETAMVRGNPARLMAGVAVLYVHRCIVFMRRERPRSYSNNEEQQQDDEQA